MYEEKTTEEWTPADGGKLEEIKLRNKQYRMIETPSFPFHKDINYLLNRLDAAERAARAFAKKAGYKVKE